MESDEMKRIFGSFYGQCIGDALGVTFEGTRSAVVKDKMAYERRQKLNSCRDYGYTLSITGSDPPFIKAGQFTDDTEMAVSLARSIILKKGFDKVDVACAYAFWLCGTKPKTSGRTTRAALRCNIMRISNKKLTSDWRNELTEEQKLRIYNEINKNTQEKNTQSLSNGSLMRISPLAIAFRNKDTSELRRLAKEDASITHANPVVADAAATYVVAIVALFKGKSKEQAFQEAYDSAETDLVRQYLKDAETRPSPVKLQMPDAFGDATMGDDRYMGYVGVAFQSAFYELLHAETFASGVEDSIARGGDTDTNACIVGALIGARFGVDGIPNDWIEAVKTAPPCLFSHENVRADLDMDFLSIQDVDTLIPQLANIKTV